jgi:hypothetical protein
LKRWIAILFCLPLFLVTSRSQAQVFYEYPMAPVVQRDEFATGSFFAVGKDDLFRVGGFGRLSATKYVDLGIELLFDHADGDFRWGAGADVKLSVFPSNTALPFDLALNTGLGFLLDDDVTIIQVPLGAVISSPFKLNSGKLLVPYVGVYVLIVNIDREFTNRPGFSDTDVDVELRAGLSYEIAPVADLFATLHLGVDELFYLGISFGL